MHTGELIGGRFELRQVLGEGGMGQVFKAWDTDLERFVAIKTLLPQFMSDPAAQAEMKQEVRITQRLNHPGIVAVYDYRVHERTPFIIMEFVDGQAMHHYLFRQPARKLDERAFLPLADAILAGVSYAHDRGVVHRDLKPANLMVLPTGHVKIMDFGIAAAVRATYTRITGHTSGLTVQYSSPEQINGESPCISMDIYALGCVFYEMLSGHPPFYQGEIIFQQLTKDPAPVPGVSSVINDAIQQCLVKAPASRLQNATEVRAALHGERRQGSWSLGGWFTPAARGGTATPGGVPALPDAPTVASAALASPMAVSAPPISRALPVALTLAGATLLGIVAWGVFAGNTSSQPAPPAPALVDLPAPAAVMDDDARSGGRPAAPAATATAPREPQAPREPARERTVDRSADDPRNPAQGDVAVSVDTLAEIRSAFNDGRVRDGIVALERAEHSATSTSDRSTLRAIRAEAVETLLERAATTLDSAQLQACEAAARLDPRAARHKACVGVIARNDHHDNEEQP